MKLILGDSSELKVINADVENDSDGNVSEVFSLIPVINGSVDTVDSIISSIETNGVTAIVNDDDTQESLGATFKDILSKSSVSGDFVVGKDDDGNEILATDTISLRLCSPDYASENLADIKNAKTAILSKTCHDLISSGVEITLTDGTVEQFGYDDDDRSNIKEMFDAVIIGATEYPYHKDGGNCKSYSKADIIKIYVAEVTNKTHHTTYYNQLKQFVLAQKSIADVNAVEYGQALTGKYKRTYDSNMEIAAAQLELILSKIGE